MSRKIVEELSELMETFSRYNDYTKTRTKALGDKQIYLQGKTCPAGTRPCDPSKRKCPDDEFALHPDIRTVEGFRCYSNANMDKPRTPEEIKSQHVKIMDFVESAAKLTAGLKGKLEKVSCSDVKSENLCGMKDMCAWSDGVCATMQGPALPKKSS